MIQWDYMSCQCNLLGLQLNTLKTPQSTAIVIPYLLTLTGPFQNPTTQKWSWKMKRAQEDILSPSILSSQCLCHLQILWKPFETLPFILSAHLPTPTPSPPILPPPPLEASPLLRPILLTMWITVVHHTTTTHLVGGQPKRQTCPKPPEPTNPQNPQIPQYPTNPSHNTAHILLTLPTCNLPM